ncbi:MAG: hypothetical protein SGJ05_01175 [bacterium]|nr:hypothetical protein [bacterium]
MSRNWFVQITVVVAALCMLSSSANARTKDKAASKDSQEEVQRVVGGTQEQQRNLVSAIDFWTTNYGIFGYNVAANSGGTFWPRGLNSSNPNQYIFAGGTWFGATKRTKGGTNEFKKLVTISYNPNSGQSWMVPGTILDGKAILRDAAARSKYRTYFSPDFNSGDGTDLSNPTYPKWPIWDASVSDTVQYNNYFGTYIHDISQRTRESNPEGPAFISGEDVFCVYKDTDLSVYEGGAARRSGEGFPLGLQVEQMIYSWGFGDYADFLFIKYVYIHPQSFPDTLFNCWMAAVMDVDISTNARSRNGGAANDRARFYADEDTLNLAVQWSEGTVGEAGRNFGYLGFNFLESPAVDGNSFIRNDKKKFPVTEQLGLRTMQNWPIAVDPPENTERYDFMAAGDRDGDDAAGDRRLLMATGPFHMRPGDSARIVVGVILASTATGQDATGTNDDMSELIRKVRFAQTVYNTNFVAPRPPDLTVIKGIGDPNGPAAFPAWGWIGFNNAVAIQWDSTAELSIDTLERGLDFMGYRIYRARRPELDTFSVDNNTGSLKGPLGWKQLTQYPLSPAFFKNSTVTIPNSSLLIDQFQLVDPITRLDRQFLVRRFGSSNEPWYSFFTNLRNARSRNYQYTLLPNGKLDVSKFDKLDSIEFTYYAVERDSLPVVTRGANQALNAAQATIATDSLIKLILGRKVKEKPIRFRDTLHTRSASTGLDTIVDIFRPWDETYEVRHNVIATYMRQITNNRTFFDYGDDNGNGKVDLSANPTSTEQLLNNIDYYYSVRAYDEGDFLAQSSPKLNSKVFGLSNVVKTKPVGARPGKENSYSVEISDADRARLGGIYNIRLLVNDQERFGQVFGGRTLQLEFFRSWFAIDLKTDVITDAEVGGYTAVMVLRDSTSKQLFGLWSSALPPELCNFSLRQLFTENTESYVDTPYVSTVYNQDGTVDRIDTSTFAQPDNNDRVIRYGQYTTAADCQSNKYALGTVGIAFDYAIQQFGGVYRSEPTVEIVQGPSGMYLGRSNVTLPETFKSDSLNSPPREYNFTDTTFVFRDPNGTAQGWDASHNNGPGIFEIEFVEGGTQTISTTFLADTAREPGQTVVTKTFENVPFLNMRVRNIRSYVRQELQPDGSTKDVVVEYPFDFSEFTVPFDTTLNNTFYPQSQRVPLDGFAVAAYGWRNSRTFESYTLASSRPLAANSNSSALRPVATDKYFLSRALSTDGRDTLDFLHTFSIAGTQWTFDFAGRGRRNASIAGKAVEGGAPVQLAPFPTQDFKVGDKIRLSTLGGALGFPFDHTKVFFKVGNSASSAGEYTDEQLNQVQIVPNPYYVTHQGIRSSFESKLYFSRLPEVCTISIYTTDGSLVRVIEHNETTSPSPNKIGADIWDLLTLNRQRIVSQTLVAKIETPNGASTIKKFTIIVGDARLTDDTGE